MQKLKTKKDFFNFIKSNITDIDISYRGGILKIDVSSIFETGDETAIMGASQNYLGGGIAGAIETGRMFDISNFSEKDRKLYEKLAEYCKQYFYYTNNGGGDDYMQDNITGAKAKNGYKRLQAMPVSAY